MKKIIKKIGGSIGIYFNTEEQKAYELKVDDVIDIEFCKVEPEERKESEVECQ